MKHTIFVLIALTILVAAPASVRAQATAQLNGRVTDESGAVLPGVTVTATQTDTGFTRTVVTDGEGAYVMPNLPTGPYRLEVSLQGFRTYVQTGIVLQVGGTPTINAVLAVGNLEETVSVEAAAPLVDVRSSGISDVVEQERIVELPLQGRQVTDLIVLAGAAVNTGNVSAFRGMPGTVAISVAGGLRVGVSYLLDGAMHNNTYDNQNLPLPFPDALQEFSVATGGLSADNGVHAVASVNAVTKSGSNRFSGNAFEFLRDKRFNAVAAFAPVGADGKKVDDALSRNQFGGTVGGPIVPDRLFFFGGYQGTRTIERPSANIAFVPSPAMIAGDFTAFASAACNGGRPVALRAPLVNNRVDPAQFSPAAMKIVNSGFLPISDDPCGKLTYTAPLDRNDHQGVSRVDYQLSANHSLFGRYMQTYEFRLPSLQKTHNALTVGQAWGTNRRARAHSLALGDTLVFGSSTVNAFRFTFNRTAVRMNDPADEFFDAPSLGIKLHTYIPGIISLGATNAFQMHGGDAVRMILDNQALQLSDDLTLVRGRHQLGFGGNVAYWTSRTENYARAVGDFTFDGTATGLSLADFMTGQLSLLRHSGPGLLPLHQVYLGLYSQDSWRVADRVTLNAGLRWEPFFGQQIENGSISVFNFENFRTGTRTQRFQNAPPGLMYPGDAGFPEGNSGMKRQWLNLSPRVGVAWDVTGDGRTAVRSSYGVSYDFVSAQVPVHCRFRAAVQQPHRTAREDDARGSVRDRAGRTDASGAQGSARQCAVSGLRRLRHSRYREQFAAGPELERHPRAADWQRVGRVGQLPRQLRRSVVGCPADQSGRVHGSGSVHDQRRGVSILHDDGEPESAPGAHPREPCGGAILRRPGSSLRRRTADVSRPQAVVPAARRGRAEPERQLHSVGLRGRHRIGVFVRAVQRRLSRSRQSVVRSRQLLAEPHTHRQHDRRRADARVRQCRAARRGIQLARLGHSERALRQLAHRDDEPGRCGHWHHRTAG